MTKQYHDVPPMYWPFIQYTDDGLARLPIDELLNHKKRVTNFVLANEDDDAVAYMGRIKAAATERLAKRTRADAQPERPASSETKPERPAPLAQVPDRFPSRDRRLPSKAFAMPLNPYEFKVFAVINARANDDGVCNPGCQRLADDAGMDVKTVMSAITRLEALDMILSRKGDFHETNTYTVRDPRKWKRTGRLPAKPRGAAKLSRSYEGRTTARRENR